MEHARCVKMISPTMARWDGKTRFTREFEGLSVSLDCAGPVVNFTWHENLALS